MPTVLITGSAGKTGRSVARALHAGGFQLRLFQPRRRKPIMADLGQVFHGDMEEPRDAARACEGVEAVYHIGPNMHPHEEQMGLWMVEAARTSGVKHFIYHSVLFPQIPAMPHHWRKLRVEQALISSGLAFTILQPAAYMQNFGNNWQAIKDSGIHQVPYPTSTRLSLVDLEEVAESAAKITLAPQHFNAIYPLANQEVLNQKQVARVMAEAAGKEIKAVELSLDDWAGQAAASTLDQDRINDFLAMFNYYAGHHFVGSGSILAWLLGREPRRLKEYLELLES
jgi:uncharacterized protein YbjT (DUF2867 family)